jgi:hypothetical protein
VFYRPLEKRIHGSAYGKFSEQLLILLDAEQILSDRSFSVNIKIIIPKSRNYAFTLLVLNWQNYINIL